MAMIDFSTARPTIGLLKKAGVTAVGRYIGWDSVPGFPTIGKNISKAEAQRYTDNGISIWLAFEYASDAVLKGAAQGAKDGKLAAQQLRALGAPEDMGVYFAIDFDLQDFAPALPDTPANAREKLGPVAHYFDAIHNEHPAFSVNGYGGYYAVKRLLDSKLISQAWQTVGWSGGQWDDRAVLRQLTTSPPIPFVDINIREHGGTVADYGQWPRPVAPQHWGEWLTKGHSSLHDVSVAVGYGEQKILSDTVRHYGALDAVIRKYVNGVFEGSVLPTDTIPPGGKLWVDR